MHYGKVFSLCHSEEHSDEESFLYRYCEDPSLSLRMTVLSQDDISDRDLFDASFQSRRAELRQINAI